MTLMATAELKSLVIPVATESVSKFRERPHIREGNAHEVVADSYDGCS